MRNLITLIFLFLTFVSKAQLDTTLKAQDVMEMEKVPVISPKPTEPFLVVQEMPEFIGGQDSMMKFIYRNLVYPPQAKENGVEGKIYVKFTVTATGEIINPKVISKEKLGYGCEYAAIIVIMKMPKWKPGRQNNIPVAVYYNLPIRFRLE